MPAFANGIPGFRVNFIGGKMAPSVSFFDPLPGWTNIFAGEESKWVRGARRYQRARVLGLQDGVEAWFVQASDGGLTLRLELNAGIDPAILRFDFGDWFVMSVMPDGSVYLANSDLRPSRWRTYAPPAASQTLGTGRGQPVVRYRDEGNQQFGLAVENYNLQEPLTVKFKLMDGGRADANALTRALPAPGGGILICRPIGIWFNIFRNDVETKITYFSGGFSVERYASQGDLQWVSYLPGGSEPTFFGFVGSKLLITGDTESRNFPVSDDALQRAVGHPTRFLALLRAEDGHLLRATHWGQATLRTLDPSQDQGYVTVVRPGTGIFFLPTARTPNMPTTPNALERCQQTECSLHVTRFDAELRRVLYATYLPANAVAVDVAPDGGLHVATTVAGTERGTLLRAAPSGDRYTAEVPVNGTPVVVASALDDSAWVNAVVNKQQTLLHINAQGEVLSSRRATVWRMQVDDRGWLHVLAGTVSYPCGSSYTLIRPDESEFLVTNLPLAASSTGRGFNAWERDGPAGRPILRSGSESVYLDEYRLGPPRLGCLFGPVVLGSIHSLYGSELTVSGGASYLDGGTWSGQLPFSLGGTSIRIDGRLAPLIAVSPRQINFVVPSDLTPGRTVEIVVEREKVLTQPTRVPLLSVFPRLFAEDGSDQLIAQNEGGELNSASTPAAPGSTLTFYGTGAGPTILRTSAGYAHPNQLAPLIEAPAFWFGSADAVFPTYAGGVPGQLVGLTQFNVRVPAFTHGSKPFPAGATDVYIELIGQPRRRVGTVYLKP